MSRGKEQHNRSVFSNRGIVLVLFGWILPITLVCAALPWTDDFEVYEGYSVGDPINGTSKDSASWTASDSYVLITNVPQDLVAGVSTQSLFVPVGSTVTNALSCSTNVIWTDLYVKPSFMPASSNLGVTAGAAVMMYFSSDGYPKVQNGSATNWVKLSVNMIGNAVTAVTEDDWARLTIYRNYTTKVWALFLNGQLLKDNLGFISSASSSHSKFSIQNETYLDDILITDVRPTNAPTHRYAELTSDIDLDGMYDAWEIQHFGSAFSTLPGSDPDNDSLSNIEEFYGSTDPNTANYFVQSIPYRAGFENATLGAVSTPYWSSLTNSGDLSVQASDAVEGSQALSISNGALALLISDTTATNVWVQMYIKPVFYDDVEEASPPDDPLATETIAFYIKTNGVVRAWSKDAWTNLTSGAVSSVPENTWLGIATHVDYTENNWDLYISTSGNSGDVMQKVNSEPLLLNDAASAVTHFSNVVIDVLAAVSIDYLAVSDAYETNNASYTNMLAYDRLAGVEQITTRPPYVYDGTNAILGYTVGNHLKRGLLDADQVKVFNTNGWNTYTLNSGDWQVYGSAMPVDEIQVGCGSGLAIKRGQGDDVVVFYPYGQNGMTNLTILGTNSTEVGGWNMLASPFSETRDLNNLGSLNMNFNNAAVGDRIYIGRSRPIFSSGKWREGLTVATNTIAAGQSFWYYHKGTGFVWQVSN